MLCFKSKVVSIYNRKTSMRLAEQEWIALDDICRRERIKRKRLLEMIEDNKAPEFGLTCFVRLFATTYMYRLIKLAELKNKPSADNQDIYHTLDMLA